MIGVMEQKMPFSPRHGGCESNGPLPTRDWTRVLGNPGEGSSLGSICFDYSRNGDTKAYRDLGSDWEPTDPGDRGERLSNCLLYLLVHVDCFRSLQ